MSANELLDRYAVPTDDGKYEVYNKFGEKIGIFSRATALSLARSFYAQRS